MIGGYFVMPIGVISDCLGVLTGSLLGCFIGKYFPNDLQKELNILMGICSIAIGITSIIKVFSMPPVIIAVLLGATVGGFMNLETKFTHFFQNILKRIPLPPVENFSMERYITAVVLFCASGFGIYGVFIESISGNSSILQSKAVLDLITAFIFAITLKYAIVLITAPMAFILVLLFLAGKLLAPAITDTMLQDFMACGGILTLAAGLRVSGIKNICIANLIPALLLVLPLSYLWNFFVP